MSVRYGVLGLLSTGQMHGYELKSRFDRLTGGFWQLNFGQVYTTLDRLEREGLVERVTDGAEGSPERKVFRITGEGRSKLDEWIEMPVAHPRALRDDLFVRLLFCKRSSPEPILRMIQRHRDVYQLEMRKLSKRKSKLVGPKGDDSLSVTELLVDAALFHAEADLRWLSHVEQKVKVRWSGASQSRRKS
ncbi:MAG TPA: PadR family transcriptional regulator [Candidatus Binatia bacterium]|nr:PadR family transcriptional regulator [Candidatus Binatia bacterium]